MKKIYVLLMFIGVFSLCFSTEANAQSNSKLNNQEEQEKPVIQIFPNPASGDILTITSKSGKSMTCRVFNVLGEMVLLKVITTKELNISSLPTGIYILRIKIGDKAVTEKLIRN